MKIKNNKKNKNSLSMLLATISVVPGILSSGNIVLADEAQTNNTSTNNTSTNDLKENNKKVHKINIKVNNEDVKNIPTVTGSIDEKAINDFSNQKTDKIINYNGKKIETKKETKKVKNAKEPKVTEKNNHVMGEASKIIPNSNHHSYSFFSVPSCDSFYLGDSSRPRQDFIDISSYQGGMGLRQFQEMKSKGIKGVVIKLTEGTSYRNPYAAQQIRYAKEAGLKVSTYHFSRFRNKAQAEAEADYYARYAKELGLGPDTLMVNDAESGELANGYGTQNSIYFALRLIRHDGFNSVLHYMSGSWCGGVLDPNALGNDSLWIAGYPYHPSNQHYQYTNREAWQFTSTMRMNGWNGNLDCNTDYTGRFTKQDKTEKPEEIKCVEVDQYKTITRKDSNVYGNTNLRSVRNNTNNLYHQTYHAERYYVINGKKYYSLYSNQNKWIGYVCEDDLQDSGEHGQGGIFFSDDFIGKISDNYAIWRSLNFDSKKIVPKQDEVYHIEGEYHHFNGDTYYSLYDKDDNWIGYINSKAVQRTKNFGNYMTFHKYVSIEKTGYGIYHDEMFDNKVSSSNSHLKETYYAKGYYNSYCNGVKYYSLYDKNGNWVGYINENACEVGINDGQSQGGINYECGQKPVKLTGDYSIWRDFNFNERGSYDSNKEYIMEREYHHANGYWYGSLYYFDKDGVEHWAGYMNENGFVNKISH